MSRVIDKTRETKETKIYIHLDIDNPGEVRVTTPVPFFNHMLHSLLFYMESEALVEAIDKQNFDDHHIVEDVAIVLGDSLAELLGDKKGIKRFSTYTIPMDEALVTVSLDISGRGGSYTDFHVKRDSVGGLSMENVPHFLDTLAKHSGITLHVIQHRGENAHHVVEAIFKGLGISLHDATRLLSSNVRSTKGSI